MCDKVKQKGLTTYSEVADELVHEYCSKYPSNLTPSEMSHDRKNVKRRVYDALNVLKAMNIICKEHKQVRWVGLPSDKKQECEELQAEKKRKIESIRSKCEVLKDLLLEQIAIRSLIKRNIRDAALDEPIPWPQCLSDDQTMHALKKIRLPFNLLRTDSATTVEYTATNDRRHYSFHFDNIFKIHSHLDVLKQLGLTNGLDTSPASFTDLKTELMSMPRNDSSQLNDDYLIRNDQHLQMACSLLPNLFKPYIQRNQTLLSKKFSFLSLYF